jgi:hypothetical protein
MRFIQGQNFSDNEACHGCFSPTRSPPCLVCASVPPCILLCCFHALPFLLISPLSHWCWFQLALANSGAYLWVQWSSRRVTIIVIPLASTIKISRYQGIRSSGLIGCEWFLSVSFKAHPMRLIPIWRETRVYLNCRFKTRTIIYILV